MEGFRTYGQPPYRALVLHGGPGAPGCAAGLCRGLAELGLGALEHLQQGKSSNELMREMLSILDSCGVERIAVIGHSYGAWLALLFAAKFPQRVAQTLLIGCGPLEEAYLPRLVEARQERKARGVDTDNYCPLPDSSGDMLFFDVEQHTALMDEAFSLRKSGRLLDAALRIPGKVTAIHGEYDPHPIEALRVLEQRLPGFTLHTLARCGHDPWKERYARDEFFALLRQELER